MRKTLSEVVDSLIEFYEQISVSMAVHPERLWLDVIDREVSVVLEEARWTREEVLDALRERVSDKWLAENGMIDMLQCCEV